MPTAEAAFACAAFCGRVAIIVFSRSLNGSSVMMIGSLPVVRMTELEIRSLSHNADGLLCEEQVDAWRQRCITGVRPVVDVIAG